MVEGASYLMLPFFGGGATTEPAPPRGTTMLDSGAPFYDAYETADSRWVAVGAIEPQFYTAFLAGLGLDPAELPEQFDTAAWPATKQRVAAIFASKSRDDWEAVFAGTDACVTPVLELDEVAEHPHHAARHFFDRRMLSAGKPDAETPAGSVQPGPAPRLSATPGRAGVSSPETGQHTDEILSQWLGLDPAASSAMHRDGVVA
jgi:alpha-methylacyl-CoA racemase